MRSYLLGARRSRRLVVLATIVALIAMLLPTAVFAAAGAPAVQSADSSYLVEGSNSGKGSYDNHRNNNNYYRNDDRDNDRYENDRHDNDKHDYDNHDYGNQGCCHQDYDKHDNDKHDNDKHDNDKHDNDRYDNDHGKKHQQVRCDDIHKVKWGDNLTRIAKKYHVSIRALQEANNIKNANRIYIGQRLCIPEQKHSSYR